MRPSRCDKMYELQVFNRQLNLGIVDLAKWADLVACENKFRSN